MTELLHPAPAFADPVVGADEAVVVADVPADDAHDDAPVGAAPHRESVLDRWWYAAGMILVIIGSDYELRLRDPREAIGGGIDAAIMFELGLYGIAALLMISRRKRPPHLSRVPLHVVLCCFWVGLMVLSIAYAAYPQYALVRAGQAVVVVAMALQAAGNGGRAHFHRAAHAFLVLIAVSVVYGVVFPSPPVNELQRGRFSWLAIHPTVAGVLTGLAMLIALAYVLAGRSERPGPHWRWQAYAVLLAMVGGALLAVHTRGAVLGAAAAIVVLIGTYLGRRGRAFAALYGTLAIGVVVLAFTDAVVTYFVRGEDPSTITTLNSRTDIWALAAHAFASEPMWGYGVGSTRGLFLDDLGIGGGHNAMVNVVVELGLIGLLCWFAMVLALTARLWRLRSAHVRLDRALMLSILTFLFIDGMFYEGPGAAANAASGWLIACVGWTYALVRAPET